MDLSAAEIADLVAQASPTPAFTGYHHLNRVIRRDRRAYLVRVPLARPYDVDLRLWPEWEIMSTARRLGLPSPRVYGVDEATGVQIHEFVDGIVVDQRWPRGARTPASFVEGVARALRAMSTIGGDALPPRPPNWPLSGDGPELLRRLMQTTSDVFDREREQGAWVYKALGLPVDPLGAIASLPEKLCSRGFVLCHCDIHRSNCILRTDGIVLLDWELALYADPAYDLAAHLHKTGYDPRDESRLTALVTTDLEAEAAQALLHDMRIYRTHERVKSVIVDAARYRTRVSAPGFTEGGERALATRLATKLHDAAPIWDGEPPSLQLVEEVLRA